MLRNLNISKFISSNSVPFIIHLEKSSSSLKSIYCTLSVSKFSKINLSTFLATQKMQNGNASSTHLPESKVKIIGTHDGKFHCDEVLACFLLRQLPEYSQSQIIRTRDPEILKTCDIVVDVGSVYDPLTLRFDHHQKSFEHSMSSLIPGKPWTTRLSSAGLIYVHYGKAVISKILGMSDKDDSVELLYDKIYEDFIEEIDGVDNGIPLNDAPLKYKVTTTLSRRVSYLNSSWKDKSSPEDDMIRFTKAMELVGSEFLDRVHYYVDDWLGSFSIVRAAFDSRFELDPSGEIMEFPNGGVPWKDHLRKLEETSKLETLVKFVLFPDQKGGWRVQGVPIQPESFTLRVPLHEKWRGLRENELVEISGIPTITFVHANGFIGGAHDHGDALKMAKLTLQSRSK